MVRALILIIDPCGDTRAMYGDYFRYHGYAVAEAANAAEGLRLFRKLMPDLIVTELSDDPEWMRAIGRIRNQRYAWTPAMIACSTMIDASWPFAPSEVDVDVALGKPISPRELLLHVELLLASHYSEAVPA